MNYAGIDDARAVYLFEPTRAWRARDVREATAIFDHPIRNVTGVQRKIQACEASLTDAAVPRRCKGMHARRRGPVRLNQFKRPHDHVPGTPPASSYHQEAAR